MIDVASFRWLASVWYPQSQLSSHTPFWMIRVKPMIFVESHTIIEFIEAFMWSCNT